MAPAVGLEPTTDRLTADCSTTELRWNNEIVFITTKTKLQVLFLKKIIFLSFYLQKNIYPSNPFGTINSASVDAKTSSNVE